MSSYADIVKGVTVRYSDKIEKYCDGLFKLFNLNHFWYYKLTNDGYIRYIGTQPEWGEVFAGEKLYLIYPNHRHPKFHKPCVNLVREIEDESLKKVCNSGSKFGLQQSLVFIDKISDGIEEFGFSTSCRDCNQTSFFLNEMPLFRYFLKKFKEDNRFLMSKFEDCRVNLAELIGPTFYTDMGHKPNRSGKLALLKKLGLEINPPLTVREVQVTRMILLGYSAGGIGPEIYLSGRTVEHHIERIKVKLDCKSKVELVQKARELEQLGLLEYL